MRLYYSRFLRRRTGTNGDALFLKSISVALELKDR